MLFRRDTVVNSATITNYLKPYPGEQIYVYDANGKVQAKGLFVEDSVVKR